MQEKYERVCGKVKEVEEEIDRLKREKDAMESVGKEREERIKGLEEEVIKAKEETMSKIDFIMELESEQKKL
jgi:chromosome segregation ATPase